MKPAGFWIRGVAFFLDLVIVNGTEFLLMFLVARALGLSPLQEQILDIGFSLLAFYIYYGVIQVRRQTTPGKAMLGLRIVNTNGDEPFTLGQGLMRGFGYLLSMLMLGCGFLMVLFHPEKVAFHDILSKTRVVRN